MTWRAEILSGVATVGATSRAREEGREGGGGYHNKNPVIKKRTKYTVLLQPCMDGVEESGEAWGRDGHVGGRVGGLSAERVGCGEGGGWW